MSIMKVAKSPVYTAIEIKEVSVKQLEEIERYDQVMPWRIENWQGEGYHLFRHGDFTPFSQPMILVFNERGNLVNYYKEKGEMVHDGYVELP